MEDYPTHEENGHSMWQSRRAVGCGKHFCD